jgi:hypothetical protein
MFKHTHRVWLAKQEKKQNTYISILWLVLWMLAKYCTTNLIVISTPYFFGNNLHPVSTGAIFFSIHCLVVSILCDRFADQPNWFPSECGTTSAPYGEKLDGCDTS